MAKFPANSLVLQILTGGSFVTIAHAVEHTVTKTNEPANTTDKDSMQWQELEEFGLEMQSISMSGFASDNAEFILLQQANENNTQPTLQVVYPDGKISQGEFNITSLEYTGTANEAQNFSATINSTGQLVWGDPATDFLLDEDGFNVLDEDGLLVQGEPT